ncbi:MAG: 1-deoxy-D-xylulose-5-phosphate reductoisomerase [Verrucomicrobia bacterium]|nr:1-deoxy-D-xylulose-5-phosphate reductoisomerase [Verrucomicrobiota bacterium]
MRRKISILGSTGSIGKNALQVADHHKETIEIVGLAVKDNIDLLEKQIEKYSPRVVAVYNKEKAHLLQKKVPHVQVLGGLEGLLEVAALSEVHTVVAAIVGSIGLLPTIQAIKAGKTIALANKEVLVSAGAYVMPLVKSHGVTLLPVDSEHNAIFQCLHTENPKAISRLILTSSGGPFRGWSLDQLKDVTVEMALRHPNFSMGAKITIDSSTLMNKGLEVIEAHWLFDVPSEKIEVLVHPQQKIHSMVEFVDGSILAEMCEPDMVVPIQYAMTYPDRMKGILPPYDFVKNGRLDFLAPDISSFRCLSLAYQALQAGGTMACYMNAANEVLVHRFLQKEISWMEIGIKLEKLMMKYDNKSDVSLETILAVDAMAREEALRI